MKGPMYDLMINMCIFFTQAIFKYKSRKLYTKSLL